jgi:hypothetical protein
MRVFALSKWVGGWGREWPGVDKDSPPFIRERDEHTRSMGEQHAMIRK